MNVAIDLELEKKCWCCDGTGEPKMGRPRDGYTREDGSCALCKGVGWTTTDLGDKVLDFLRRHVKPECFNTPTA